MDELRSHQPIGRVGSAPICQVPGCHAEADFREPTSRDGNGSAALLYLCSKHYTLVGPRSSVAREVRTEGRPFVILVEDDPVTAQMYQTGLEAAGFAVMVVGDGSKLFKALENEVPNIVVLDWELPGILSGVDIIDNLRLDDRTAELPVIMLSNLPGDNGLQDRAFRAGAPWLLKVRTTPAQLADRISQVLRRRP